MARNSKILFVGDICLNGVYEKMYLNGENPFTAFSSKIEKDTLVVGNLECFSRGDAGVNKLKIPRLETSVETLNYLKEIKLNIACLANNHVYDHLDDGFNKTIDFLSKNNIRTTGASIDKNDLKKPLIIDKNGIKICLLNFVAKDTNPKQPNGTMIKLNWFDLNKTINEIKQLKHKVNHIVVSLHWGGRVEGGLYPDFDQPKIAKNLIDSGADLIIGHHSHTIQPYEKYRGKYIFYSLGNFCFSDFVFEGENYIMSKRRKYALTVSVTFNKYNYHISNNYFFNKNGKLIPSNHYSLKVEIRNLIFKNLLKFMFFWKIYYFNIKKILPIFYYLKRDDLSFKQKFYRLNFRKFKKYLRN